MLHLRAMKLWCSWVQVMLWMKANDQAGAGEHGVTTMSLLSVLSVVPSAAVQQMLDAGVAVDAADNSRNTPLALAATS